MLVKIPKGVIAPAVFSVGNTHCQVDDALAREIFNEMSFRYFKEDFANFLECNNENVVFCNTDREIVWCKLWNKYQDLQDQNVAEWDTFRDVLKEVLDELGNLECSECGKKLLSGIPIADADGNCYCNECEADTDFCDLCSGLFHERCLHQVGDCLYCDNCLKEAHTND